MRWRLLVPVMIALFLIMAVVAVRWRTAERGRMETADELQKARSTNSALHDSLAMLSRRILAAQQSASFWTAQWSRAQREQAMLLTENEIFDLEQMGLADPVKDLRQDLHAHPELIPFDGIHGSRMGFLEDRIALLSKQWVYAEFEDGHIGGCCLLSYEVTPSGGISWKVLSATLE